MARLIEAVVFDYGGVLSASPFAAIARREAQIGLEPGTIADALGFGLHVPETAPGEPVTNFFHLLEVGQVTIEEYGAWASARVKAVFGPDADVRSVMSGGFGQMGVQWMVVQRARRLRDEGYRLAICTNNIAAYRDTWTRQIPMELWDVVIDSCEVGVRKPDPAIYLMTCEALGVEPDRTAFLDDHPGNVVGAEAVGMRGIVVGADPWEALAALDALLAIES